jgi:hypothetical protein
VTPIRTTALTIINDAVKPGRNITSKNDSAEFARLTGTTHENLVANWKSNNNTGQKSACNGFVAWYAQQVGITKHLNAQFKSWFNLEASLRACGMGHAWVPAAYTPEPQPGDILHHSRNGTGLHVDVCVGFASGKRLIRAAAGQITFLKPRNPDRETDVLKQVTGDGAYNYRNLIGWLDLDRFFGAVPKSAAAPTTNWAIGWWSVTDGQQYYYYFAADNQVQYIRQRPVSLFAPAKAPSSIGQYSFLEDNRLFIHWSSGTEEKFTPDGPRTAMEGKSSRYGGLVAKRM